MSAAARTGRARPAWRAVAIPDEHGGWGLTTEPVLLGLLVAPSWAGGALAVGAVAAFVARTPLKLALVDRWRHRQLARSKLAARIAAAELALLAVLALVAGRRAGWDWLVPVAIAAPLVAVELWFDMQSRSRRLVPEVCGAVGIAAAAASIALAGGASGRLAAALWLILAARALASVPFVRAQIRRLRHGSTHPASSDRAQIAGVVVALVALATDAAVAAGAAAVVAVAGSQLASVRRPPVPAKTLGLRQLVLGLAVVAITATGVLLT